MSLMIMDRILLLQRHRLLQRRRIRIRSRNRNRILLPDLLQSRRGICDSSWMAKKFASGTGFTDNCFFPNMLNLVSINMFFSNLGDGWSHLAPDFPAVASSSSSTSSTNSTGDDPWLEFLEG